MPKYLHPGIYVEEIPSGGQVINSIQTSETAFIGTAPKGPIGKPENVTSYNEFQQKFGTGMSRGEMPIQISQFFKNGGRSAWVVRVQGTTPKGNGAKNRRLPKLSHYKEAFSTLIDMDGDFNILVLPRCKQGDVVQTDKQRLKLWPIASRMCQNQFAFLIIDPPNWAEVSEVQAGIQSVRDGVAGKQAAIYWPKVIVADEQGVRHTIDPSGSLAGVYARTDAKRGVWKASAGLEAALTGVRALAYDVADEGNSITNSLAVNTIRQIAQDIVVWGARTIAGFDGTQETEWRYVPVRRLRLMIEKSLVQGLDITAFENNDRHLWAHIKNASEVFLRKLWTAGALTGTTPKQAYFVRCDETTMTQNDIANGIVIVHVGFAPLKPAEFVVLTIRLMTNPN